MFEDTTSEDIADLVDHSMFDVEVRDEEEARIVVTASPNPHRNVNIIQKTVDGPLTLTVRMNFPSGLLATIFDHEKARRDLLIQLASVIANAPGQYLFLDEKDRICSFKKMSAIELNYAIYPDGLSQQRLMDNIFELLTAINYIQQATKVMGENLKSQS